MLHLRVLRSSLNKPVTVIDNLFQHSLPFDGGEFTGQSRNNAINQYIALIARREDHATWQPNLQAQRS